MTADDLGQFLSDVLQLRGEFGRLLLVLADAERRDRTHGDGFRRKAWWERRKRRKAVAEQLRRCLAVVES